MLIVKSSVTSESEPTAFVKICVAVLLEAVYVFPSIQMKGEHSVLVSVPNEKLAIIVAGEIFVQPSPLNVIALICTG